MELKIRIKEVKEEMRELTIEEWAMYLLSKNERSIYQHDAQDIVKSWGLIEFENGLIGFRTETIRDATPEEIIAWHGRSVMDICSKTESLGVFERIRHIPAGDEWVKAKALLDGKEVILELV